MSGEDQEAHSDGPDGQGSGGQEDAGQERGRGDEEMSQSPEDGQDGGEDPPDFGRGHEVPFAFGVVEVVSSSASGAAPPTQLVPDQLARPPTPAVAVWTYWPEVH